MTESNKPCLKFEMETLDGIMNITLAPCCKQDQDITCIQFTLSSSESKDKTTVKVACSSHPMLCKVLGEMKIPLTEIKDGSTHYISGTNSPYVVSVNQHIKSHYDIHCPPGSNSQLVVYLTMSTLNTAINRSC